MTARMTLALKKGYEALAREELAESIATLGAAPIATVEAPKSKGPRKPWTTRMRNRASTNKKLWYSQLSTTKKHEFLNRLHSNRHVSAGSLN